MAERDQAGRQGQSMAGAAAVATEGEPDLRQRLLLRRAMTQRSQVEGKVHRATWASNYGTKQANNGKTFDEYKGSLGTLEASSEVKDRDGKNRGTKMKQPVPLAVVLQIFPLLKEAATAKPDVLAKASSYVEEMNDAFRLMKIDTVEARSAYLAHAFVESKQFQSFTEGEVNPSYDKDQDKPQSLALDDAYFAKAATGNVGTKEKPIPTDKKAYSPGGSIKGNASANKDAFIGRGAMQVTHRQYYVQTIAILEKEAETLAKDPARAADAAKLQKAAEEIKEAPANASKPANAMLISAAYMKMKFEGKESGPHGESGDAKSNRGNATSWMGTQPEREKKDDAFARAKALLMPIAKAAESSGGTDEQRGHASHEQKHQDSKVPGRDPPATS